MTYSEALAYFASLEPRGWRLGLDRMRAFCIAAGLENALGAAGGPAFVHVAGTNGKGSTTAFLQSMMVESGARTGAFFSPYVLDPRERVQFGREMISRADLARLTESLIPVVDSFDDTEFGGVTEFELKTALGFAYWRNRQCDFVALEVGLGGRFDATNVVTPKCSAIISISLDHTAILGDTEAAIAFEKAGIIKREIPVVVGSVSSEAFDVIAAVARGNASPLLRFGEDFGWIDEEAGFGTVWTPTRRVEHVRTGLVGTMQGHNFAVALTASELAGLALSHDQVRRGAERASVPGRFQRITVDGREWVLDGAHNAQSADVLVDSLRLHYPGRRICLLTGMVKGHDPKLFFAPFQGLDVAAHVVPIDNPRAQDASVVEAALKELAISTQPFDSFTDGLLNFRQTAPDDLHVVTGSFYLVGQALKALD